MLCIHLLGVLQCQVPSLFICLCHCDRHPASHGKGAICYLLCPVTGISFLLLQSNSSSATRWFLSLCCLFLRDDTLVISIVQSEHFCIGIPTSSKRKSCLTPSSQPWKSYFQTQEEGGTFSGVINLSFYWETVPMPANLECLRIFNWQWGESSLREWIIFK